MCEAPAAAVRLQTLSETRNLLRLVFQTQPRSAKSGHYPVLSSIAPLAAQSYTPAPHAARHGGTNDVARVHRCTSTLSLKRKILPVATGSKDAPRTRTLGSVRYVVQRT